MSATRFSEGSGEVLDAQTVVEIYQIVAQRLRNKKRPGSEVLLPNCASGLSAAGRHVGAVRFPWVVSVGPFSGACLRWVSASRSMEKYKKKYKIKNRKRGVEGK